VSTGTGLLLELSCALKVSIGHECQLCFVPAICACPRQGETPLRLRAIICAHRHKLHCALPRLTMREWRSRYEIYVNRRCMTNSGNLSDFAQRGSPPLSWSKGDEVVSITARHKFIGMDPPIWRET